MVKNKDISVFQRYLSIWVILCMIAGVMIGHFFPAVVQMLNKMQIAGISIPIAILIWIMIYPMMIKVDFQSIRQIKDNPKGLFLTWIVNWLISCRSCFTRGSTLYSDGLRLEHFDPWPCSLYYRAGCN